MLVAEALSATRESKAVEFKSSFNPSSSGEWCEILKDVVAMANAGGGVIAIGLDNRGNPTEADVAPIISLDPAKIIDKVSSYTRVTDLEIEVVESKKNGQKIAILVVPGATYPVIFTSPGTYQLSDGKQRTAFGIGTFFTRHGAKSIHGTTDDMRRFVDDKIGSIRATWLKGLRKIVQAPAGATVRVLPPEVQQSESANATPIRIVDDPTAPAYQLLDPDKTHPYRQKEVVETLNQKIVGRKVNAYDLLVVRKVYETDKNPRFQYRSKFGSPQYSPQFVEWLLKQQSSAPQFFDETRKKCSKN